MSIPESAKIIEVAPDQFDVKWDAERTFPFFEDENADGVYGYGHIDKSAFARLVNDYDTLCDPSRDPEDCYTADAVTHCYAVAYQMEEWPDGEWAFAQEGVTSETPGAFPMTSVSR